MSGDQKRAFIAVVISGIILFGWQYFFAPKPIKGNTSEIGVVNKPVATDPVASPSLPMNPAQQKFILSNEHISFEISDTLGVKNIKFNQAVFSFVDIVGENKGFDLKFFNAETFKQVVWTLQEQLANKLVLQSELGTVDFVINDKNQLEWALHLTTPEKFQFELSAEKKKGTSGAQSQFVYLDKSYNHEPVGDDETGEGAYKWVGIDYNYHFMGIVFPEKLTSVFRMEKEGVFKVRTTQAYTEFKGKIVFFKKEYNYLKTLGDNLNQTLHFGFWAFIAEPVLWGMQKIHQFVPNYGLVIIILTLLVRLLLTPLQISSLKSMKKMQAVQPELAALKEKYKNDPAKMQAETMAIFKKAGANPLGGCLPLLLQMPVFFAFYAVLQNSVELVGAPFFGWITDLSVKDPYYVTPVLMTIAMFLQQRFTPSTTVDATQKKIMMFMPLIFGFILKDYPAGLSLYILISTLFGVAQQYLTQRATS